ncbi:flagellar protein FlgN [Roseovarius ramblicola]|uniref:Flagellar protein FlgN n=1 Tax=Roseovarius ramblicola TaxID=2022336 RepID=A0ABV5HWN7_9RHOB
MTAPDPHRPDPHRIEARLESLLARERAALLSGDLHAVGALAPEKEALAAELGTLGAGALAALRRLGGTARRNQALLDGTLQGIRRAGARLSACRRLRGAMDTYDPQGRKTTIAGPLEHKVERRA